MDAKVAQTPGTDGESQVQGDWMACPKSLFKARRETDSSSSSCLTLPLSPGAQEGDVCAPLPALDPREVQQGL